MKNGRKEKKNRIHVIIAEPLFPFFVFISAVVLFSMSYLFINQARGAFRSDLVAHINSAIAFRGYYSLVSPVLKVAYTLAGRTGCGVCLAIVSYMTMLAAGMLLQRCLQWSGSGVSLNWSSAMLIGVAVCFLGGIYIPNVYPLFYLYHNYTGVGTASSICMQPWQNSTYLLMRLFGIVTLMYFFRIHSYYLRSGVRPRDWIGFTAMLTLTNAAKPNFFIAFAPAMLAVLIYDCIKTRFRGVKHIFCFGVGVLCSMPVLLVQKGMLFPEAQTAEAQVAEKASVHGIALTLDVVKKMLQEGTVQPYLISGLLFFAVITVLCAWHGEMTSQLTVGWIMLVIAIAESQFVVETGPRAYAGNFGWGVPFFALVMSVICIERLISLQSRLCRSVIPFVVTPLALMMITGICYFAYLLGGGDFIA